MLLATAGEESVPVAADGTVLPGVDVGGLKTPSVERGRLPAKAGSAATRSQMALVMGAAPEPLLELVEKMAIGGERGRSR